MNLQLILIIIIALLIIIIITNLFKFKKIKSSFLEEIDQYEEKLIEEKSKRKDAELKMDSYIHLKKDLHAEDFLEEEVKINNNKDLYNNITKFLHRENKNIINKIINNVLIMTKGHDIATNEIHNESEILLSLSELNINYQNILFGKSNPKLEKLITLAIHHKKKYFIINNDLEKTIKEHDTQKIKKLLSIWSNQKYTQTITTALTKKHFMTAKDTLKIIAVISDTALEKLNKINPKIIKEFNNKEIQIQNISNLSQFIQRSG